LASPQGANGRAAPLLEVRSLHAAYGAVPVLFGVTLRVHAGEMVALVGPNAAGKSTLLRVIAGLRPSTDGSVHVRGVDMTGSTPQQFVAQGVALVPENKAIFPDMTVSENLEMAAYTLGRALQAERRERVYAVFPRLRDRLRQQAGSLSGGEKQMLSLAKAVLLEPQLLLIDELSLGLSPITVEALLAAVRDLNEHGTSVLLIEQSLNLAASVCERAILLEKGEVAFEGTTAELLDQPSLSKAVLFGGHVGERI
jgi:branched-chain amino acid transport system ATP-binding protein